MNNTRTLADRYLDSSLNQADAYLKVADDCARALDRLERIYAPSVSDRSAVRQASKGLLDALCEVERLFEETLQRIDPAQKGYGGILYFPDHERRQNARARLEALRRGITLARHPKIDARKAGFVAPVELITPLG
jgi:hypothetical protein